MASSRVLPKTSVVVMIWLGGGREMPLGITASISAVPLYSLPLDWRVDSVLGSVIRIPPGRLPLMTSSMALRAFSFALAPSLPSHAALSLWPAFVASLDFLLSSAAFRDSDLYLLKALACFRVVSSSLMTSFDAPEAFAFCRFPSALLRFFAVSSTASLANLPKAEVWVKRVCRDGETKRPPSLPMTSMPGRKGRISGVAWTAPLIVFCRARSESVTETPALSAAVLPVPWTAAPTSSSRSPIALAAPSSSTTCAGIRAVLTVFSSADIGIPRGRTIVRKGLAVALAVAKGCATVVKGDLIAPIPMPVAILLSVAPVLAAAAALPATGTMKSTSAPTLADLTQSGDSSQVRIVPKMGMEFRAISVARLAVEGCASRTVLTKSFLLGPMTLSSQSSLLSTTIAPSSGGLSPGVSPRVGSTVSGQCSATCLGALLTAWPCNPTSCTCSS